MKTTLIRLVAVLAISGALTAAPLASITSNGYVIANPGALLVTVDEDIANATNSEYAAFANCIDRDRNTNTPFVLVGELSAINSLNLAAQAIVFEQMWSAASQYDMTALAYAVWWLRDLAGPHFGASPSIAVAAYNQAASLAGDYSSLAHIQLFTPISDGEKLPDQRFLVGTQPLSDSEAPEPVTSGLVGAALVGIGWLRRRR